jgi:hypothetical protein
VEPVKVPCSKCGSMIDMHVAKPAIINHLSFSQIIVEHPQQEVCTQCGETMTAAIQALQGIALVAFPVPKEHQQLIVPAGNMPGNGLKIVKG